MNKRQAVLAATLALLVGVTGAAAPIGLAKSPTATTIRGIDVDASTIPELQALMNAHKLTSVQLVQFYFQRIKKLNPMLHAIITLSLTALKDAQAAAKVRRKRDRRSVAVRPRSPHQTALPPRLRPWRASHHAKSRPGAIPSAADRHS